MKRFNLLPGELINERRRRALAIGMLIAQAVIITVAVISFPVLNYLMSYIETRSEELALTISHPDYLKSERAAAELTLLRGVVSASGYMTEILEPETVNGEWLAAVNDTVPPGATLTGFEISGGRLTINCRAGELPLAEVHLQRLAEAGFSPALGGVVLSDGLYNYTLHVSE